MRRLWVAGAAFVMTGASAGSGSAAEQVDCGNAQTTYEMQFCADKDFKAADAEMNQAYQAAIARAAGQEAPAPYDGKAYEAALRAAQRAWVAYRDADCKGVVPFSWQGGTGTGAAVIGCLTAKTQSRTKDLREMVEAP